MSNDIYRFAKEVLISNENYEKNKTPKKRSVDCVKDKLINSIKLLYKIIHVLREDIIVPKPANICSSDTDKIGLEI